MLTTLSAQREMWLALAGSISLQLACSSEDKSYSGEPTPYERSVAEQRLRGDLPDKPGSSSKPLILTGDADHDFLVTMSRHAKNVIVISNAALESNTYPDLQSVIREVAERHGHELDALTTVLRRVYNDHSLATASAHAIAEAEHFRHSGIGSRVTFLNSIVGQDTGGRSLADSYLPKLRRAEVERLAYRLRDGETLDLIALKKRLAAKPQP